MTFRDNHYCISLAHDVVSTTAKLVAFVLAYDDANHWLVKG